MSPYSKYEPGFSLFGSNTSNMLHLKYRDYYIYYQNTYRNWMWKLMHD